MAPLAQGNLAERVLFKVLAHYFIRVPSQLCSALTGGWYNPWRDPAVMMFLSTSMRAGRGQEMGNWFWTPVARLIDAAFIPLDGPDHCARHWQGYRADRGI